MILNNEQNIFTILTVAFIILIIRCIARIYIHRNSVNEMKKIKAQSDMYIMLFEGLIVIYNRCIAQNPLYVKVTLTLFLIYLSIVKILSSPKRAKMICLLIPPILVIWAVMGEDINSFLEKMF